jgi:hypothetical protein
MADPIRGPGRPTKYVLADGTEVRGVTTVLGRWKESGGLLQWAFQVGKSGAASLYAGRDAAADVGQHVHQMVRSDLHGESLPAMPATFTVLQTQQAESAFYAWLRWRQDRKLTVVATEVPLVSELYRFGGTIDVVWRDSGGLCMGDWKSANGVYTDNLLQLAAYGILWDEHHPDDMVRGGYHLARFSKEQGDFEHRYWPDLSDAREEFLLLLEAYEIDRKLKKRAA